MSKLNAKFVVAIAATNTFEFEDADKASRFQRSLQRYSAKMYRRLAGKVGQLGMSPCVGSDLNAYPIKSDGSVSEDGMTLATAESEINFVEKEKKDKRAPKAPAAPKTPRRGRKSQDETPAPDPVETDEDEDEDEDEE